MKRQIPALLLAFCLLLTLPAQAAQEPGFARSRTYAGEFSDLTPASPFYGNAVALYEYGLSNGKGDGTFGLGDPVTLGQAVIFAGRVRGLYRTGDAEAALAYRRETTPGALAYLRYLQAEGALEADFVKDYMGFYAPASRAQVAHVLAKVLPEEALPSVHDELVTVGYSSRRFIPDVDEYTPYYQDILALYRKGISVGSDAAGSFLPDQPITRGALAAMLTRMLDPALRVRPQWDLSHLYSAAGTTLGDLVEPGEYVLSPSNQAELESSLRYMLAQGGDQLIFHLPGLSEETSRQLMDASLTVMKDYCEQGYNQVHCIWGAGLVTLSFSAAGAERRTQEYRAAAMEAAVAVHDRLWNEGVLRLDMTEREKALVYYDWICDNCAYDYQAGDDSLSHIPYSLFAKQTAVCDGYTGAYNLLLKLEGIQCSTIIRGDHIWTVAKLDGAEVHIDTTWGDSGSEISYDYFAMTPQQSMKVHAEKNVLRAA
ncbi:S-layer homology domain-containing protein [Oscillibacter sp.]|uniref:S-layer homology domain-containing protein n=1 Tax=Oscillibacter sp. TaxID=1945593 RepID=UPI002D80E8A7|nr:S-layer homology domain-containing protein [Oscillibacter sp.]